MRYLSVCAGIEAASVAWHPLGWTSVAFSEIEKFPSAVLAHHYPGVVNLGDLTRYREWPDDLGPDLIVGGTPCQSFSVAGLRKGLDDPRGNLALVFLGLVDKYRPRWVVWENVPGVRSSTGGTPASPPPDRVGMGPGDRVVDEVEYDETSDFGCFLAALGELGYGYTYRSLDAQYFGLAQRRKRVFVVGYLGDWRPPAAVLLEPEGLRGDPPPRREAGEVAPTIPARSLGGGGLGTDFDCDGGLVTDASAFPTCGTLSDGAHMGGGLNGQDAYTGRILPMVPVIDKRTGQVGEGVSPTLKTDLAHDMGPVVAIRTANTGANGHGVAEDVAHTLDQTNGQAVAVAIPLKEPNKHLSDKGAKANALHGEDGDPAFTLNANWPQGVAHSPAVAFSAKDHGADAGEVAPTLRSMGHDKSHANGGGQVAVLAPALTASNDPSRSPQSQEVTRQVEAVHAATMAVRRLTPTECSILQGFPTDYLELVYADADEAHSAQVLHELWREAGAEAPQGQGRRTGVVAALLAPEVLLAGVYGNWISWTLAARCLAEAVPMAGQADRQSRLVRLLRCNAESRRSPHQRESFGQLAVELGIPLSELPLEGPQIRAHLRRSQLWPEAQAKWPLRYAFAEGKEAVKRNPDGPRYKALGNSMAVPVMRWIGERIALYASLEAEGAFDGSEVG